MAIDDQLDQVRQQYPEEAANVGFEGAMYLLSLVPQTGPVAAIIQGLREHFSSLRAIHRLQALFDALEATVRRQGKSLDDLRAQIGNPRAAESIIRAVEITVQISNEWKIENFGKILGSQAASGDSDGWDEASALVEDLSRLTDDDIKALEVLVRHQSHFVKLNPTTHDYNNLVASMRAIFQELDSSRVGRGEFYSHAFRLIGFGLAVPLNFSPSAMGPQDQGVGVTLRGVRLMKMLGDI